MSGRRNLDPGGMPTWSTMGLQSTGLPSPLDRDLIAIPAELRPRTYETNDGRTAGGSLGLGAGFGPIANDYARPGESAPGSSPTSAPEGCTDCG